MYPPKEDLYYQPPPQHTAPPMTTGFPITTALPPLDIQAQAAGPWSSGLCDCCDDVGNCCVTCFCPCITFGQIAEIVDRGSSSCGASGALYALIACVTGCPCLYSCFYRAKMRRQYVLRESPCCDCCVHCCCEHLALCQEYRELKRRGFDMHIGWQANLEKQQAQQAAMLPPGVHESMTR